jgi:signal peptidase I
METMDITPAASLQQRLKRALTELFEVIVIAGILFLGVNLVTARVRVESISMEPSLHAGEFVIVNKLAYRWEEPQRGDIIVFRFPLNPDKRYIKRVIGIEGDSIEVRDGQVYLNALLLEEPYIVAAPNYANEWQVPENKFFVLGDNRNNSNDSKNWGMLEEDLVIGKAEFIYWPIEEMGGVPHYDLIGASGE